MRIPSRLTVVMAAVRSAARPGREGVLVHSTSDRKPRCTDVLMVLTLADSRSDIFVSFPESPVLEGTITLGCVRVSRSP